VKSIEKRIFFDWDEMKLGEQLLEAGIRMVLTDHPAVLFASDEIEELSGFKAEDFVTSAVSLRDLIHRGDSGLVRHLFCPDLESRCGTFCLRLRQANGKIRCVRAVYTKESSRDGNQIILDLVLQDAKTLSTGQNPYTFSLSNIGLLDAVDDFIYLKDRNHVITAANRTSIEPFANLEGDNSSLIGLTDYDIFSEELADRFYALEEEVYAGSDVAHELQQCVRVGDLKSWIDIRKCPIRDETGEVVGLLGISRDLTELKPAQKEARAQEELLRISQSIARVGSYILELRDQTAVCSEEMARILGIDVICEMSRAEWTALIHPDDRERVVANLAKAVKSGGAGLDWEYRITRPVDMVERWVHEIGRLECDTDGNPVRVLGTIQDISEHKQAEESLREIAEVLKDSQRIARLGSYDLDVATSVWVGSEVMDQVLGFDTHTTHTAEEWAGIVHPDDRQEMVDFYRDQVVGKGIRFDREYRIIRRNDKALRWVHGIGNLEFDAGGNVIKMGGTIQDVTERKLADARIRESEQVLQLFIRHAPAALAMFDREMKYLAVSSRWMDESCLGDRNIIGLTHFEVFPEIPDRWREVYRRALAGETVSIVDDRFERLNGKVELINWEARPWLAGDGKVGGIIIFSENITKYKLAQDRLHLIGNVFKHAREGIMITGPDGTILEVNEMFTNMAGYTRDEVIGKNPRFLKSGHHDREFYREMWRCMTEDGQWSGEVWNRTKNGDLFATMQTITAVTDDAGKTQQYIALFSDITKIKEQERKIESLAHYDPITGLPNRALTAVLLRQAMGEARLRENHLAVALFDIDGFGTLDEQYGREKSDKSLVSFASRIGLALRDGDLLAHLGSDEFIVVLRGLTAPEDGLPLVRSLVSQLSEPIMVDDLSLTISASVGVTFFPQADAATADLLLRQADQAMYQAKLAGKKGIHVFDPNQDRSARGHLEDIERIRMALEAREFIFHYQPKVNMATGAVVGAEALIRWQHPERGLLPPSVFLPAIESHPIALEMAEWAIEEALSQMETWSAQGLELSVSVNINALQLKQVDFVDRMRGHLARHPKISPAKLEFEVVETSALEDVDQVTQKLSTCRDLGISVALDDFGTGYSSLTYLKRLPANVLKIDQSFVRDMMDDPEDLAILEGVLSLATAFRREVTAEGVETAAQGLMLLQLGCEWAQGYGIGRPMPASELPAWVASWRPNPEWAGVKVIPREDRALLCASVEHRAWIRELEDFLKSERRTPPPSEPNQCRFWAWVNSNKHSKCASSAIFQSCEELHRQVHTIGAEILQLKAEGRVDEGLAKLPEISALQNTLLEQIQGLLKLC